MNQPHDPDAWLDDVRRWFYGGTEPADRGPGAAPVTPAPPAGTSSPAERGAGGQSTSANASICRSTGSGS